MNNKILFLIVCLNAFFIEAQTSMEAKKLLENVSKQIESYDNIKFEFNYVLNNRKEQINQESKGEITVAGDLYKLDFLEATQLYDGKSLHTIIPENEEVLISKPDQEDTAILNPTELIDIYKSGYDFHWDIAQRVRGNNIQFVKLIPTEESQDVSYILLGINTKSKNIYKLIEVGKQRTTTTLTLENFSINKILPNELFVFNKVDYPGFYIN
jgi:outer membrane lipoprotein-sorting protein